MTPARDVDAWMAHPDRFDRAEADPQHTIAMKLPAPKAPVLTTIIVPALVLALAIAIAAYVTSIFAEVGGRAWALIPVGVGVVGVLVSVPLLRSAIRNARGPVLRRVAVVVDERTEVSSLRTMGDMTTETLYYATLQFRDGGRIELVTNSGVAGFATRGDIGLAVIRGGALVDFHRYRLPA